MAPESRNSHKDSAVPQRDGGQTRAPPSTFVIVKIYDPRGELTLYRLSPSTPFTCGRCNKEKTAKLVATYRNQWNNLRYNTYYGKLLSED